MLLKWDVFHCLSIFRLLIEGCFLARNSFSDQPLTFLSFSAWLHWLLRLLGCLRLCCLDPWLLISSKATDLRVSIGLLLLNITDVAAAPPATITWRRWSWQEFGMMWGLSALLSRLISHFGRSFRSNWNLSLFNIARACFKSEWILDWLLVLLGELFLSQSSVDPLKHTFLRDHTLWAFLYLDLSSQLTFSPSLLQRRPRFLRCTWRGRWQPFCVRVVAAGRIIWIFHVFDFKLLDARIRSEKSWIWKSMRVIELRVIKHGVVCSWIFVVAPRFLKCKTLLFWLTLRIYFTRAVRSKQCLS